MVEILSFFYAKYRNRKEIKIMIYGYARVSTKGQAKDGNSLEAQENALRSAGATEIYADAFTGTKTHRPELDKLMAVMQEGDTMVVTKLDRIARSATQGIEFREGRSKKFSKIQINHAMELLEQYSYKPANVKKLNEICNSYGINSKTKI